jgi:hypothetical protein
MNPDIRLDLASEFYCILSCRDCKYLRSAAFSYRGSYHSEMAVFRFDDRYDRVHIDEVFPDLYEGRSYIHQVSLSRLFEEC